MNHRRFPEHNSGPALVATILISLLCLPTAPLAALEEDASQPVVIEAQSSDYSLEGTLQLFGSEEKPVRITQGTLEITGREVHIEQVGEAIHKVTAYGEPAHFQQQLNAGQEPIQASGLTLSFDNVAQVISIVEQAEIILWNGTRSTGYQFEYDLGARHMRSVEGPGGEPVRIVIPPGTGQ